MIYLEDNILDHPKMVAAGDDGFAMWMRGMQWLKQQRSSTGRIPKAVVIARLAPIFGGKALQPAPIMRRLISAGCWHDEGDYVLVHGYVERNEASIQRSELAKEKADKRWAKERERRANGHAPADAPASDLQVPQHEPGTCNSPQSTDHVEAPSLTHPVVAPQDEGGSEDTAAVRSGMARVDRTLRDSCPPAMNRLYGERRARMRALLTEGADVELALAAIRQGAPSEGAPLRADRAIDAMEAGKVPQGDRPPYMRTFVAEEVVITDEERAARLAEIVKRRAAS